MVGYWVNLLEWQRVEVSERLSAVQKDWQWVNYSGKKLAQTEAAMKENWMVWNLGILTDWS